ncbi:MAG: ABC transporter permease [Rhizobiales bacterium]|nr:ABC transporter permease [Hyphomicrobiales bacterium]
MIRSVLARLIKAALVVLAVAILNFSLVRLAPGDPATVLAGQSGAADEKFVAQLRADFGLDKPIQVQLLQYFSKVLTLDLGYSYRQNKPVIDVILERLPNTLTLTLSAFIFSLFAGVSLGIIAAWRRGTFVDSAISLAALLFYAMPIFFTGLLLLFIFSAKLEWLPGYGSQTVGSNFDFLSSIVDRAKHLVLPMLTLGLFYTATYTRLTRASAIEVMHLDYIKTARAKGLPTRRIRRAHVLRNAILPVITIAGMQLGQLIGGAVVVETIFGWPGIGRLAFDALLQRDYPVLLGIFFISSMMVVLFNVLTEFAYRAFDPRVRSEA